MVIDDDPYFAKAIAEGSGLLKPAVVVMHGPPGAGKTSVKQLLLGRPPIPPDQQHSTGNMLIVCLEHLIICTGLMIA